MTKYIIAISITLLLLASVAFYYGNQITNPQSTIASYDARREDIYLSQQKIERYLNDLNQSVKAELDTQKALTAKIAELSVKADLPPPVINTTRIVQEPPTVVKVPVPVTRPPVTSAS